MSMSRSLLRTALAAGAVMLGVAAWSSSALAEGTGATARAASPMPPHRAHTPPQLAHMPPGNRAKRPTVKPTQRPHAVARAAAGTVIIGGPGTETRYVDLGCGQWFWWNSIQHWGYACTTQIYMSGEWQQTDMYHYYLSGSTIYYYGDYRCWKTGSGGVVIVTNPVGSQQTCRWV
jgi:hypothetical protein